MEQSSALFHEHPGQYIHRSLFSFDTGLKLAPLQNFIYIPLDIFRRMPHNELTELEAWLYFLGSDDPADIMRIVKKYPFFQKLYQDIVNFRFQPKELIAMYSDALRIMDENTIKYMVDEMRAEMDSMTAKMNEMNAEMNKMSAEKDKMCAERDRMCAELSARSDALKAQQDENAELRTRLAQYQKQDDKPYCSSLPPAPSAVRTKRLLLRPLTAADAPAVFEWVSDERVARYMVYTTYTSIEQTAEWLKSIEKDTGEHFFGFERLSDGKLIGSGSIGPDRKPGFWGFGYNLRYDCWGMGYATEAAKAMIEYARKYFGAEHFASSHCEPNLASGNVMKKCGLRFVGYGTFQKLDGSCKMRSMEYEG